MALSIKDPCVVTLGLEDFLMSQKDALVLAEMAPRIHKARYNIKAQDGWIIGDRPTFMLSLVHTDRLSEEPAQEDEQP